jgi:multisubunit Na+/H+ antiporter MnhG subunit
VKKDLASGAILLVSAIPVVAVFLREFGFGVFLVAAIVSIAAAVAAALLARARDNRLAHRAFGGGKRGGVYSVRLR